MMEKPHIRPLTPRHVCTLALPSITAGRSEWTRNRESSGSFHRKDASFSSLDTTNTSEQQLNISSNSSVQSNVSRQSSRTALTTTSSTTVPLKNTRPAPTGESMRSNKIAGIGLASPPNSKVGSPLLIAFGEFLLVPTLDAYILIYSIMDFSTESVLRSQSSPSSLLQKNQSAVDIQRGDASPQSFLRPNSSSSLFEEQQRLDLSEREKMKTAIEPIRILGPLYVDHTHCKNENIAASIIAITSTPLHSQWTLEHTIVQTQDDGVAPETESSFLGYVAAATSEGDIHLFSFYNPMSRDGSGSSDPPVIHHIISFFTGYMGATCLTFATANTIVIGFDSGRILCFRIPLDSSTIVPSNPELIWSACFENSIQSISFQGYVHKSFPDIKGENPRGTNFLLVGLSMKNRRNASIQPSLEVVDMDWIRDQWIQLSMSGIKEALRLECFSLWPQSGMELRDIDWNKITKDLGEDVYLSYALSKYEGKSIKNKNESPHDRTLSVDCIAPFHGKVPAFVATFSNGTVAIIHWMNDNHIHYGVKNERNQIIMAAPCMGLGIFDETVLQENEHISLRHRNSIACCTRGGIIWVLPTSPFPDGKSNPEDLQQQQIIRYQLPYDPFGDDDGVARYIQGFTAGYVKMKCWRSLEVRVEPLMFHAWSGGLIDVYSCDMAMELQESVEDNKSLFSLLLDNGAIHALIKYLLDQACDSLHDIDTDLLERARKECNHAGKDVEAIVKQMVMVGARGFDAFNDLLYTFINATTS